MFQTNKVLHDFSEFEKVKTELEELNAENQELLGENEDLLDLKVKFENEINIIREENFKLKESLEQMKNECEALKTQVTP